MFGLPPHFVEIGWRVGALLAAGACAIVLLDVVKPVRAIRPAAMADKQRRARASLWPRFWVWVACTGALLGSAALGRVGFGLLLALLSIQAVREVAGAFRMRQLSISPRLLMIAAPLVVLSGIGWSAAGATVAAAAGVLLAGAVGVAARRGAAGPIARAAITGAALGYVALPLAVLTAILNRPNGFALVAWLLIVTVLSDTLAMFGGLALGRRRIAATLSPGKTMEGVGAGFAGALAGAAVMRFAFPVASPGLFYGAAIGVAAAALAGDLLASMIKRAAGLKDFSRFLPGHGGLMDRLDSLLISVPGLVLFVWLGAFR
jgi:phosphatidate cytidylyltransferase